MLVCIGTVRPTVMSPRMGTSVRHGLSDGVTEGIAGYIEAELGIGPCVHAGGTAILGSEYRRYVTRWNGQVTRISLRGGRI